MTPNLVYPAPGPTAVRPHAPVSICGVAVTYDADGNTLTYDSDGAGTAVLPRSFVYDGENRPVAITQNANTTSFAYGPDGERAAKAAGTATTWYLGSDAEIATSSTIANDPGTVTSYLHPDVKREGSATAWLMKDHLASNRLATFMPGQGTAQRSDYTASGQPIISATTGSARINGRAGEF